MCPNGRDDGGSRTAECPSGRRRGSTDVEVGDDRGHLSVAASPEVSGLANGIRHPEVEGASAGRSGACDGWPAVSVSWPRM